MNFGDDDIVIFGDGSMLFGDDVFHSTVTVRWGIVEIIEPEDSEYWDYFFDIEE